MLLLVCGVMDCCSGRSWSRSILPGISATHLRSPWTIETPTQLVDRRVHQGKVKAKPVGPASMLPMWRISLVLPICLVTVPAYSNPPDSAPTKSSENQKTHPAAADEKPAYNPAGTDKQPFVVKSLEAVPTSYSCSPIGSTPLKIAFRSGSSQSGSSHFER